MATDKDTAAFIRTKLGSSFTIRSMFGEYALYAEGKVVGFICDNLLYVKILDQSKELEDICEKGPPYPGAKLYYIVTEDLLTTLPRLPKILLHIAEHLPTPKKKK